MKIKVDEFYKTRKGQKVRVYATDGYPPFTIHGALLMKDESCEEDYWELACWKENGQYSNIDKDNSDIVSEWEDRLRPVKLGLEHGFNYNRASFLVEPGMWILYFPPNRNIIETHDYHNLPDRLRGKKLETNNWVKTDETGYFEGTSIEDVRFIPESKYFKQVPRENLSDAAQDSLVYGTGYYRIDCDEIGFSVFGDKSTANNMIIDQSNQLKPRSGYAIANVQERALKYLKIAETGRLGYIAAICSCGGKIDSHKPECPENQEIMNEIHPFYILDESPQRYLGMPEQKKCCECGSESLGSPKHSDYCPKFKED